MPFRQWIGKPFIGKAIKVLALAREHAETEKGGMRGGEHDPLDQMDRSGFWPALN